MQICDMLIDLTQVPESKTATEPQWVVYKATNRSNGKVYIGYTRDLQRRMNSHRNTARRGSALPLHAAIRKHGWESFLFDILNSFSAEAEAKAEERRLIAAGRFQLRGIGYNVADGGDGIGSQGARAVHRRPAFRAQLLASMPSRHAKAQATKRLNNANTTAAAKAAETKRINGTDQLASIKAAATRAAARLASAGRSGRTDREQATLIPGSPHLR